MRITRGTDVNAPAILEMRDDFVSIVQHGSKSVSMEYLTPLIELHFSTKFGPKDLIRSVVVRLG